MIVSPPNVAVSFLLNIELIFYILPFNDIMLSVFIQNGIFCYFHLKS